MILVTGAAGTTGRALIQTLVEQGQPVRAWVRQPQQAQLWADQALVQVVAGDLADATVQAQALRGVRAMYLVSSAAPDSAALQQGLIDAARQAGVQRVVKHSGLGASADSPIHLARWHAAIEQHLQQSGLEYVILRPHFFMQNLLWDAGSVQQQQTIMAPMGDAAMSMIDVRDIAAVAAQVLTRSQHVNEVLELTGPAAVSYHDIARELSLSLERPVRYQSISAADYRAGLTQAGMPAWFVDDMSTMFEFFASGQAGFISPAVASHTGQAGRTLAAFIREHAAAFGAA